MFRRLMAAAVVSTLVAMPSPALAQQRHAFVVGIDRYDHLPPDRQLRNAVNDARTVAATLQRLGFQVATAENVGRLDLITRWHAFLGRVEPGDVAAFFFAGHAVEIGQRNYLLPADVLRPAASAEQVLRAVALPLNDFLEQLRERAPLLALHIIDACRDNPFRDATGRSIGASRGLARIETPRRAGRGGTFVMFSADAGETALDRLPGQDPEANSVYTRVLVRHLVRPKLDLVDIARTVRSEVVSLTRPINHQQNPAYYDGFDGRFCPADCPVEGQPPPPPPTFDPSAEAASVWAGVKDTGSIAMLEAFIARYPSTVYADLARARITELRRAQAPPAPPSPPPPVPMAMTRAYELDIIGGDLHASGIRPVSLERCEAICLSDPSCRAYTFVQDRQWCWPKSEAISTARKPGMVSGIRQGLSMPPPPAAQMTRMVGIDLFGGDLTAEGHRPVSLDQCESICLDDGRCAAYTWVQDKEWCWPKSEVGRPSRKDNVISGRKM